MDGTSTFVIIVFLATAIERAIEATINPLFDALSNGKYGLPQWQPGELVKRFLALVLGLGGGFAIALGLKLDLINPLLTQSALNSEQAKILTGILLGGGSAPAHEIIRYVEEKKQKAAGEKEVTEAEAQERAAAVQKALMERAVAVAPKGARLEAEPS
jgi:hypothetical protein